MARVGVNGSLGLILGLGLRLGVGLVLGLGLGCGLGTVLLAFESFSDVTFAFDDFTGNGMLLGVASEESAPVDAVGAVDAA